jgi:hypothetical protein
MKYVFLCILCIFSSSVFAQQNYKTPSVLSGGTWGKIGVVREGIYRIDASMLVALGFPASVASNSIGLFGNGGAMLPENNALPRINDLAENAIEISDGGDGVFSGSDFLLFYAPGPHRWITGSDGVSFSFQKNLYSDTAFYFITAGPAAGGSLPRKRIAAADSLLNPSFFINSFLDRYARENPLRNLLSSGKYWVGEAFNNRFGGTASRTFSLNWAGVLGLDPVRVLTHTTSRSISAPAQFVVSLNGSTLQTNLFSPVSGGLLDAFAREIRSASSTSVSGGPLNLQFNYQSADPGADGWLNSFSILARRVLQFYDPANEPDNTPGFLRFRDPASVLPADPGAVGEFSIANAPAGTRVWDVSDSLNPIKMPVSLNGNIARFNNRLNRLREYLAFGPTHTMAPIALGAVPNHNLHNLPPVHGIIVTHPSLLAQAQRLADFHLQQYGFTDAVVTVNQIYNEFASGSPDPTAIRDFVKWMVNKSANTAVQPKYLLLFGAGSFDPKNRISNNVNLVPVYESNNSLDPLLSFTSDDFFGLIGNTDNINNLNSPAPLTIAVGRIPVATAADAAIMVDKIIRYHSPASLGDWRKEMVFLADDQDNNLHLSDAESIVAAAADVNPVLHPNKIYLDAFPLVSGAGGARYPAVSEAIVNQILSGALLFNYSGHGNDQRLTEEAVFSSVEANRFNNPNKLPLFITASCDFAPHDDPAKQSLGEFLLHGNTAGGIALLTTTRLVFAYSNRIMNEQFMKVALQRGANGQYLSLGESVRIAKNNTAASGGDILNSRKFALLGDPAMQLALPKGLMRIDSINGAALSSSDSLQALGKYRLSGSVLLPAGGVDASFNGTASVIIYDKPQLIKTLGNKASSPVTPFSEQRSVLFNGKVAVSNGLFNCSFILPKDIRFAPGFGSISLYAFNGISDAAGSTSIGISGFAAAVPSDSKGPDIRLFLNDTLFMNGGLSNESPVLIALLSDSSGINATGNSIGHDITLVIDGASNNQLVLNNAFSYRTNSYQSGELQFQLPVLSPGKHSLKLKAWDVLNNSNDASLDFWISSQEKLTISAVRNFPNPFAGSTQFSFEHNQRNTNLFVEIFISDSQGRLVKRLSERVNSSGSRNVQLHWNGDTGFGRKLSRGTYFYRIIVSTITQQTQYTGQLLLL